MGNSEVGHMNIGSGRVVAQDLPRIDSAIEDGSLANRPALTDLIAKAKAAKGGVHLMGLLSPGGVHSHQDHMAALTNILSAAGLPVLVHAFLDGRDTPPKSARGFAEKFLKDIEGAPGVRLATVSGRYYAMDRDKRWTLPMPATSPTNSCCPQCWATMPAWPMATLCCSPISAPTGRGRFRWHCWTRGSRISNVHAA
jgi:bisphosphoglycerate-independent phosphoglycerate mutase